MASTQKTVIVTGASQGIGAAVVRAFLERGYNVVGTSRNATTSAELEASDKLALVDGDIGQETTAREAVNTAIQKFGTVDAIVNNAGIFLAKPFTDYSAADFSALVSTNLEGYIYITQFAVKQMLAQKSGGSVVGITSSLVENPIGGLPVSLPMITKRTSFVSFKTFGTASIRTWTPFRSSNLPTKYRAVQRGKCLFSSNSLCICT